MQDSKPDTEASTGEAAVLGEPTPIPVAESVGQTTRGARYFIGDAPEALRTPPTTFAGQAACFSSNNNLAGRFTVPLDINVFTVCGGVRMDFTHADFIHETTQVNGFWVCGGINVVVPRGVRVRVNGVWAICGGSADETERATANGTVDKDVFPTLEFNGLVVCGGLQVEVDESADPIVVQ